MKREELINQAAEQFADREHGAMRNVSVFNLLQYAFKCGAEWAGDNYLAQVWHPASERPKDERFNILCKEDDDHFFMLDNTDWLREEKWEDFTDAFWMTYWADPSDLFPKGNVPSTKSVPSKCTKMSKTRKHQATYDYLSNNKEVRGRLLIGILKFFNRCNWPKWDSSRKRWHRYKIQKNEPTN